jgi:hypothetical protein
VEGTDTGGPSAEPLRQALAAFEAAHMPSWTEQARLDLGRVLAALGHPEARETLRTARDALAALRSPLQMEAADALAALDEAAVRTGRDLLRDRP